MNSLYILLVVWQIFRTESAAISSVEILNLNDLGRYERSADDAATQNNLNYNTNCDGAYKAITPNHSKCLVDVGTAVPLTITKKDQALAIHNEYRTKVSPKATNMQKMYWDLELASIATKWAQQCKSGHDSPKSRMTIYSFQNAYIGQNVAAGQPNLNAAIKGWFKEVFDYKYGYGSKYGKAIGNYTQIVQHMSSRIGCGKASCPNTPYKSFYVCNYAIGQTNVAFPYTKGTSSCSDCPKFCQDNLCDCGGKLCQNSGTLDIKTCTCECPRLYGGDECQYLQCTNREQSWCRTNYTEADCAQNSNLRIDCYMMCGICPYPCNGKQCENGRWLNPYTCKCVLE